MKTLKLSLITTFSLIAIFVFTGAYRSTAQVNVAIGPKVGASFSGFWGDDAGNINFREGLAGGLFISITPRPFFSIQPELLLQQKGAVNRNDEFNFIEDVEIGYFNVPVLLKFRIPIFHIFFPHVLLGPQFSYKFKSNYTIQTLDASMTREIDLRNYDLGGVFGAGFDIQSKHLFFNVDARYTLGTLSLDSAEEFDLKNSDISIMMGIGFMF